MMNVDPTSAPMPMLSGTVKPTEAWLILAVMLGRVAWEFWTERQDWQSVEGA
jgi:hypothetical protein